MRIIVIFILMAWYFLKYRYLRDDLSTFGHCDTRNILRCLHFLEQWDHSRIPAATKAPKRRQKSPESTLAPPRSKFSEPLVLRYRITQLIQMIHLSSHDYLTLSIVHGILKSIAQHNIIQRLRIGTNQLISLRVWSLRNNRSIYRWFYFVSGND